MPYRVNHVDKKTGVTYVYESVSFWDKEKHQARNTQVCVGKLDPVSGEFIPSKRLTPGNVSAAVVATHLPVTATALIVGPSFILDNLSESLGLPKLLKAAFPSCHRRCFLPPTTSPVRQVL